MAFTMASIEVAWVGRVCIDIDANSLNDKDLPRYFNA